MRTNIEAHSLPTRRSSDLGAPTSRVRRSSRPREARRLRSRGGAPADRAHLCRPHRERRRRRDRHRGAEVRRVHPGPERGGGRAGRRRRRSRLHVQSRREHRRRVHRGKGGAPRLRRGATSVGGYGGPFRGPPCESREGRRRRTAERSRIRSATRATAGRPRRRSGPCGLVHGLRRRRARAQAHRRRSGGRTHALDGLRSRRRRVPREYRGSAADRRRRRRRSDRPPSCGAGGPRRTARARHRCWPAAPVLCVRRRRAARGRGRPAQAAPMELKVSDTATTEAFDFETRGIEGWTSVTGRWAIEEMAGAPSGTRVLVQRATNNEFNVIVAPTSYADVDVTMKFKPISGREDASGGIVFRFNDGKYYVVRANALENNFRLYYYDRGRREIASAKVKPPALGQWHTVRVVAVGDRIQAWLDGVRHLDRRDTRFKAGRVGLWTKADSVTAFDDLSIRGTKGA